MRLKTIAVGWWIKLIILFSISQIIVSSVNGQSIKISYVEVSGSDILIYYNLEDLNKENSYSINLFSSYDNYKSPVNNVDGDVGIEVPVGENKQIIWHAGEELGVDFKGRITLELKGQIYIPFVSFDGLKNSYKRGKSETVAWRGGSSGTVLTWELYNEDNDLVHTFPPVPNVGNYDLIIPKDIKPGSNYRFKISDSKNRDDVVFTTVFSIKRKIPLVATIGAGLVTTAGIVVLIQSLGKGEDDLPVPPNLN